MKKIILILTCLLVSINSWSNSECVSNVEDDFNRLSTKLDQKYYYSPKKNTFERRNQFTLYPTNKLGINNHFQGLTPLGSYFLLAGGDKGRSESYLYLLGNKKMLSKIVIGYKPNWHIGGIQSSGPYVAFALEPYLAKKAARTVVKIYNYSNPYAPFEIKGLNLPTFASSTPSVALTKLVNGKYLLAVFERGKYNFFLSKTRNLSDGFLSPVTMNQPSGIGGISANLITQCNGDLYLIDFDYIKKKGIKALPINGKDIASLFKLNLSKTKNIKKIGKKEFDCERHCIFRAAGGVQIKNRQLHIISTNMYRKFQTGDVTVGEFSPKGK